MPGTFAWRSRSLPRRVSRAREPSSVHGSRFVSARWIAVSWIGKRRGGRDDRFSFSPGLIRTPPEGRYSLGRRAFTTGSSLCFFFLFIIFSVPLFLRKEERTQDSVPHGSVLQRLSRSSEPGREVPWEHGGAIDRLTRRCSHKRGSSVHSLCCVTKAGASLSQVSGLFWAG